MLITTSRHFELVGGGTEIERDRDEGCGTVNSTIGFGVDDGEP